MSDGYISDEGQSGRILKLLKERSGEWVPAPELSAISLQYCARIFALRKAGVEIENRTERSGKIRHGFYRIPIAGRDNEIRTIPYRMDTIKPAQLPLLQTQEATWHDPEEEGMRV